MIAKYRPPHKDTGAILKEAARRVDLPTRRLFLRNAIGLGSLTFLSGCDVVDGVSRADAPEHVRFQRQGTGLVVRSKQACARI
jgi:hypothetical protein